MCYTPEVVFLPLLKLRRRNATYMLQIIVISIKNRRVTCFYFVPSITSITVSFHSHLCVTLSGCRVCPGLSWEPVDSSTVDCSLEIQLRQPGYNLLQLINGIVRFSKLMDEFGELALKRAMMKMWELLQPLLPPHTVNASQVTLELNVTKNNYNQIIYFICSTGNFLSVGAVKQKKSYKTFTLFHISKQRCNIS